MSDKKWTMTRFLSDQVRVKEDRLSAARRRDAEYQKSLGVREKLATIAAETFAEDQEQASVIKAAIEMMRQRDDLMKFHDYYDEARHYLERAGYGHPSGVEDMPTVLDMVEHALNHRSQIQGHCHAALKHLGVTEEWITKIYSGHMQEFFEAHLGVPEEAPLCGEDGCENPGCQPVNETVEMVKRLVPEAYDWYGEPDEEPEEDPGFEYPPNYGDILYRKQTGSWPEGEMPKWVQERQFARDARWSTIGDTELELIALEYEHKKLLKRLASRGEADPLAGQALDDMRRATAEVQRKLCETLKAAGFLDGASDWTNIVGAVGVLARDVEHWKQAHEKASADCTVVSRQLNEKESRLRGLEAKVTGLEKAYEDRDSVLMALKVVRDIIVEADALIQKAFGHEPTQDAEYASDLLPAVKRLIHERAEFKEEMEKEKASHLRAVQKFNEEIRVFQEGDETEAGTWKLHYIGLCQEIGIPRSVYGDVRAPKVDEIARYMGQAYTPLKKLCERVEAVERRLPMTAAETAMAVEKGREMLREMESADKSICDNCGKAIPVGVAFCPSCGEDNVQEES